MQRSEQAIKQNGVEIAEVLTEQYLPRVFQYISYWVKDTRLAEDLTMVVLKKGLARSSACRLDRCSFSAWLFATSRNTIRDHLRKRAHKPTYQCLTVQQQEIVSLKFGAGLDNPAIAKVLGLPEPAVGAELGRCLYKLRGSFGE